MVLVTHEAPDFIAPAVLSDGTIVNEFNLKSQMQGQYCVLFFWPLDFTSVCPTEIIAFNNRYEKFKERQVEIIGVSVDSFAAHAAWREMPVEKGGIGPVKYTMVSDVTHEITKAYGVEHPAKKIALRASFLIDKNFVIRHQVVNDLPLGRDIDEMLRMVDALQSHEKHGEVCPAGWKKDGERISSAPDGTAKFLEKHSNSL